MNCELSADVTYVTSLGDWRPKAVAIRYLPAQMEMIFEVFTYVTITYGTSTGNAALISLRDRSPRWRVNWVRLTHSSSPWPPDRPPWLYSVCWQPSRSSPLAFFSLLISTGLVALLPDRLFEFCFGDFLFGWESIWDNRCWHVDIPMWGVKVYSLEPPPYYNTKYKYDTSDTDYTTSFAQLDNVHTVNKAVGLLCKHN